MAVTFCAGRAIAAPSTCQIQNLEVRVTSLSPQLSIVSVSQHNAVNQNAVNSTLRCRPRPRLCQEGQRLRRVKWLVIAHASVAGTAVGAAGGEGGATEDGIGHTDQELSAEPAVTSPREEKHVLERDAKSWWQNWQSNASELRAKVAKLGLSAVLAYGLFDGVTYTTFFVLAFLGYEKSTGLNPATNLKSLLGIVVLMWTGNNFTRPFRVAGAAALAPVIDRGLKRLHKILKLPNLAFTFMFVVVSFASLCFSVVGLLILSRLGRL